MHQPILDSIESNEIPPSCCSLVCLHHVVPMNMLRALLVIAGVIALSRGLSFATKLQSISLSLAPASGTHMRSLQPGDAARLLTAMCRLPALCSLTLGHMRGCTAAAAAALPAAQTLQNLGLSNWRMTGDQLVQWQLGAALSKLPALTSLHVSGNFLVETGAQALAGVMHERAAVQDGVPLRELVLEDNCMGADAAAAHLGAGLRVCTGLTRLSLSWNRFTAAGARAIASALCGADDMTHRSAGAVAEGLASGAAAGPPKLARGCAGLQELIVRQEWSDLRGIEEIARAVEGLPCISEVDVRAPARTALEDACGYLGDGAREEVERVVEKVRAKKPDMLFKM